MADYAAQLHVGFVKHGFVLAMHLLMRHKDKGVSEIYDFAMTYTVALAGDTDTNCAIVGGVIGAYVGVDMIDKEKLKKLLECKIARN